MRETHFISKRETDWSEWERKRFEKDLSPDDVRKLLDKSSDDLSFARTHYPNRSIRLYLTNALASTYRLLNKGTSRLKIKKLWLEDVPDSIWRHWRVLLTSFIIFSLAFLIGVLSQYQDQQFVYKILGPDYMAQTLENIESGRPMDIYASSDPFPMFLQIGFNNVRVMLFCMVLGITFGIGTVFILLYNGIMIGCFLAFFWQQDLGSASFFAVMLHGTLELSAIILSGFTGLILANGLMFPKTLDRTQSLILSAKDGIRVAIGLLPFIVFAAFIEGYFTRHAGENPFASGVLILASFLIIVGYYVVFPMYRGKKGKTNEGHLDSLPRETMDILFSKIKSVGEIFASGFYMLRKSKLSVLLTPALVASAITAIYLFDMSRETQSLEDGLAIPDFFDQTIYAGQSALSRILDFLNYPIQAILLVTTMAYLFLLVNKQIQSTIYKLEQKISPVDFIKSFGIAAAFYLSIALANVYSNGVLIFLSSLCLLFLYPVLGMLFWKFSDQDPKAVKLALQGGGYKKMFVVNALFVLFSFTTLALFQSDIFYFLKDAVLTNFDFESASALRFEQGFDLFVLLFALLTLWTLGLYLYFFAFRHAYEIATASDLNESINLFGTKKRTYGLETE